MRNRGKKQKEVEKAEKKVEAKAAKVDKKEESKKCLDAKKSSENTKKSDKSDNRKSWDKNKQGSTDVDEGIETDSHGIPHNMEKLDKIVEPPPLSEYKLDDKYIKKHLGELTMAEESGLMKLRRRIPQSHTGKVPDESVILRFLRARDCNVDKAFEMLKNSLHWRRQHHVDTILQSWNPPADLLEYYPGGWHHQDKDGRPIYIIRLGSMDIKGLMKSVGEDGFVKQVVCINEEATVKCKEATLKFGRPITNWTCICDLEGLSMRHLWRPGVRALLNIIEVVEANYPETIARLLIVRAPKVFGVVWTLLYPFIDENTRKKFLIYTGDDYQGPGGLADFVVPDYLPEFLGGKCPCDIQPGKPVPKTFYKYSHFGDGGDSSWLGSDMYHSAYVMKGSPHDVMLTVTEAEAVITWDFDVIDGDCVFNVLRHKRPRELSDYDGNATSCLGDSSLSKQTIRVGVDATVVEKPINCNRGESIQGSHICQQPGIYILQWKFANSASKIGTSLRIQPKTKVMFYHEILPSKDFKGSISSISSSTSGFSQLSMASSMRSSQSMTPSATSSGIHADMSVPREAPSSSSSLATSSVSTSAQPPATR